MSPNSAIALLIGGAALALVVRLVAGSMDRSRIAAYLKTRGSALLSASWKPFGNGWIGERGDRIYRIRYRDASGAIREADCKTRALSGVYLSEDQVIERQAIGGEHSSGRAARRAQAKKARRRT